MLIVPIAMRTKVTKDEAIARIHRQFFACTDEATQLHTPYHVQSSGNFVRVFRRQTLSGNPIRPTLSLLIQSEELGSKINGAIRASSALTIATILWIVPVSLILLFISIAALIPPAEGIWGLWIVLPIAILTILAPLLGYLQARKRAKSEGLLMYRRFAHALREK